MNRCELVKAAIGHRAAERPPYFIDICPEACEVFGARLGVKDWGAFLDNDVADVSAPWWDWHELGPDWAGIDVPKSRPAVMGRGSYDAMMDGIKAARDAQAEKYLLVRIYGSHFEKAYFSRGFENFLADMGGAPEFARNLLGLIIEKNMVMLENILHLPEIDGVLLGSDWGSQRGLLMSPAVWQDMIRPGEQKEYDLIHAYGKDVWVHSCGDIGAIIPSLVEMGLDVLNPVQPEAMDIAGLKRRHGSKLAFWGGISTQKTLPFGTPDEVRREARRVRDMMSVDGGYIFAPAQSIQADVPAENLLALLEAAREIPG
ncbi:MAG: hypothetical protein GX608_02455 [Lentisphaerae bacterium]|nr:hypothetical protein [Lentisphaerota bacterium]